MDLEIQTFNEHLPLWQVICTMGVSLYLLEYNYFPLTLNLFCLHSSSIFGHETLADYLDRFDTYANFKDLGLYRKIITLYLLYSLDFFCMYTNYRGMFIE